MTTCHATYTESYASEQRPAIPMPCFKTVNQQGLHRGQHQTFVGYPAYVSVKPVTHEEVDIPARVMLVDFSDGGAGLVKYDPAEPYTNCSCVNAAKRNDLGVLTRLGHTPEDHRWTTCVQCTSIIDATREPATCAMCGIWARRSDEAESGKWRYLRAQGEDNLYSFDAANPGGFGGRRFTIVMLDGTVVAKDQAGLWSAGKVPWEWSADFPPNCTIEPGTGADRVPGHMTPSGRPMDFNGSGAR